MATLVSATDYSFDPEVLKCDIPVAVSFWADWCVPCRAINEYLAQISSEDPERLKAVGVDIESNPNVTASYNVLKIPTLILFKNGQEVTRLQGNQTKQSVLEAISPYFDQ